MNRPSNDKPPIAVQSTSGRLNGMMYWSASESTWLLLFRIPNDPRRRLRRRVADMDAARASLDEAEAGWLAALERAKSGGPRFLTPEQQMDALRALDLLAGRASLAEAAAEFLRHHLAVDFMLTERTTVREAFDAFVAVKGAEGATPATQQTYCSRFSPVLSLPLANAPWKHLTRSRVAGLCREMTESAAYGFLTVVSSFENYLNRRFFGFDSRHHMFAVLPIREAARFFCMGGVIEKDFPEKAEIVRQWSHETEEWSWRVSGIISPDLVDQTTEPFIDKFADIVHRWDTDHPRKASKLL